MTRILVADVPQMDERYAAALPGETLAFVRTMDEAKRALAAGCDLVVIGVHFDDSQMFDLVRAIRSAEERAKLPIVCVRGPGGCTALASRSLETTAKALGADAFLDLLHCASDEAANASLATACAGRTSGGTP